jgi:hypothetical protein
MLNATETAADTSIRASPFEIEHVIKIGLEGIPSLLPPTATSELICQALAASRAGIAGGA